MKIIRAIWSRKATILGALIASWWIYYSYNRFEFTIFVSYCALLVASFAALAALLSLKYTRDTVRPFLSFNGTINVGPTTLAFPIRNTGSMPANDIGFHVDAFGLKEANGLKNISKKYTRFFEQPIEDHEATLIIFPNQTWQQVLGPLPRTKYKKWWGLLLNEKIKLRITITYKSFGRKHKTIQTFKFDKLSLSEDGKHFHGISIEPQKWV